MHCLKAHNTLQNGRLFSIHTMVQYMVQLKVGHILCSGQLVLVKKKQISVWYLATLCDFASHTLLVFDSEEANALHAMLPETRVQFDLKGSLYYSLKLPPGISRYPVQFFTPRSVLWAFWAPLIQMTHTPPHSIPDMRFESK